MSISLRPPFVSQEITASPTELTYSVADLTAEEIADIEAAGAEGPPSRFNPLVQVRRVMRGGVHALTATAIVFLNICMAYMIFHWLRVVFRL